MDLGSLAALAVNTNSAMARQETSVAMTKMAMESKTQVAIQLTDQVTEAAKAAAKAATTGGIDILV
ncbi:MAG: hypothetical protein OQK35_06155 [Alphaproteobacteria bacterium]|nr:hypothetical protein [Rhodospirillales bacterium]MCW9045900.1 hypothetical protein [Alphaproteobacteria bacterium]